jgi:hypothetical protein
MKSIDSTGQLSLTLTLLKNLANGVTLSRAKDHQIRLNYKRVSSLLQDMIKSATHCQESSHQTNQ